MAEYINRELARLEAKRYFKNLDEIQEDLDMIFCMLPAEDVAPVVRCRECEHWKPTGSKAGNSFSDMEYIGGCEFTNYCRRESDFCSYGERKEGAE